MYEQLFVFQWFRFKCMFKSGDFSFTDALNGFNLDIVFPDYEQHEKS